MQNFLGDTGFDRFSESSIRQNLGMGCGIGKKTVLWDRDDRSSGCGIVMKKELECGIRTPWPLQSLMRLQLWPYHYYSVKFILPMG